MSYRTSVHESLPYIDREPTASERAAADSLIEAELSANPEKSSALPPLQEPQFSLLVTAELERIASKQPLSAIDLKRYEEQDAPSSSDPSALQTALSKAYTASTYLAARQTHLSLLDSFGKNAWLIANWQTESELAVLERELAQTKTQIEVVNNGRRRAQDEVGGELRGLEESWKRGIGRVLETEIAVEKLKREVLERRRAGGGGGE
ncbi:Pre-mRNA-splicing factor SPF27 [Xylariales sp. AK1849]|nr:Pre-mRNA-splicing factor SPF27 [Xylariales sp. AK1849]